MNLFLKIWKQENAEAEGYFETHNVNDVSPDSSFLEMLDQLNGELLKQKKEPVTFDHDCREGVCGTCSLTINGYPHGKNDSTTTCQLHMRKFEDGDSITIEPFRAEAFPVVKDLMVDRSAFDKIIQAGGYVSVRTGSAPDGNSLPIQKETADVAMDAAACIGCGACVTSCKNASAMLFTSAKLAHLNSLPQGQAEKDKRTIGMVEKMDTLGFGSCSNYGECSAACPKDIPLDFIAKMNRDYATAKVKSAFKK